MSKRKKKEKGLISGVFLAYLILILHVVLAIFLGLCVVFFKGVVSYMLWILLGGIGLVLLSGYLFYRRIKKGSGKIRDILNDPAFRGRSVEVSLLGGVASIKVGQPTDQSPTLDYNPSPPVHQLEAPETVRMRELKELVRLLEDNLITEEEYNQFKKEILQGTYQQGFVNC